MAPYMTIAEAAHIYGLDPDLLVLDPGALIRVKDDLTRREENRRMNRHLAHVTRNVPRYTSYPTSPHFTGDVDGQTCAAWLQEVAADATISFYLHVPFCRALP
jgi:hypothetical protein